MTTYEKYKNYIKETEYLAHATQLMYWDMMTIAPQGGKEKLIKSISHFETEVFKRQTSDEFYDIICELSQPENLAQLAEHDQYSVKRYKIDMDKDRRVPEELFAKYVEAKARCHSQWAEAKLNNNYAGYEAIFDELIQLTKEYQKCKNPDVQIYDAMIDEYETGMTQETIDRVFGELKERLVPLVDKITALPKPDVSKLHQNVPAYQQEAICKYLLDYMGFDMNRGVMSQSEHPFTDGFSINDVRITTHYYENDIISAMFSTIHEGGHAIFEQNINPEYEDSLAASVNMMGLHESQSRFYENILGRNINFWKPIYADIQEIAPALKDVSLDEFYKAINCIENSLIRTEADEVTYALHIILRYELERAIMIDGVSTSELPAMWNAKMQELLHIVPETDTVGILQDMHWSEGAFGYFPSYLLGSIYDGMYIEAIEKDLGPIDQVLSEGRIKDITAWLNTNIHQYGALRTSAEVLEKICGKELSAAPLMDYFEKKYSVVYNL